MMSNNILMKISFLLSVVLLTLSKDNQILCFNNSILLETAGDAILTIFVDANYGQNCNISSPKGLQQVSTALHVIQTLNKYDYVPGWQLGLRALDTCHDKIRLFKQVLRTAVERNYAADCRPILVPSSYSSVLEPLRNYGGVTFGTYGESNFTGPAIEILAHYLSTKYEVVDRVHAGTQPILDRFSRAARNVGVCVRRDRRAEVDANVTETVIVAIGEISDVRRWVRRSEAAAKGAGETWLLLPLDNSDGIDDLMPAGSYVIKPETLDFDRFESSTELPKSHRDSANRSPHILSIGKAIVELAEVVRDVRRRNYSADDDDNGNCVVSGFREKSWKEIRDFDVYEALRMQPRSHLVKYVVAMKTQYELIDVALYEIEVSKSRVLPKKMLSGVPGLCLRNLVRNCENCTNFQDARVVMKVDIVSKSVLKNSIYVPIFIIAVMCGAFVCCVVATFIVHRFTSEERLDGNPGLTIVLILANVFTLLTALPFCIADDYFGAENLNSRKILLTALAHGFTFSIMLSRALCLALFADGAHVARVNGYLQCLMAFIMSGVQVAMSIMYFVMSTNTRSSAVVRSPVFIALLGYDIFLLLALLVASYSISHIQRNYFEGKCFFGTAVGLLVTWTTWLICFVLTQPENRDTIVTFGTIGTAYTVILGVLIPRAYCMIVHPARGKSFRQTFNLVDPPGDPTVSTTVGQKTKKLDVTRVAPRTSADNAEITNFEVASNDVTYAQPKVYVAERVILKERRNANITCNRNDFSSTLELQKETRPMRYMSHTRIGKEEKVDVDGNESEGDVDEETVSRITRF